MKRHSDRVVLGLQLGNGAKTKSSYGTSLAVVVVAASGPSAGARSVDAVGAGFQPHRLSLGLSVRHPSSPEGSTETGYVGIAGKHGAFGIEKPNGFADFTDGTSDSIVLIELKTGMPWTKPDDLMLDSLEWKSQALFEKAFTQLPFFDPEKICVGLADGSTYVLDKEKLHVEIKTTMDKAPAWMNLFTIDDGNPINVLDCQFTQQ